MALLIKNVTTYQKTKPLYEAYRKARNKEKYRAEHERGIILHEAAAKALKAAQIGGKLPSVPVLQAEYEKAARTERKPLCRLWQAEKNRCRKYDVIKTEHRQYFTDREAAGAGKGRQSADKDTKK